MEYHIDIKNNDKNYWQRNNVDESQNTYAE